MKKLFKWLFIFIWLGLNANAQLIEGPILRRVTLEEATQLVKTYYSHPDADYYQLVTDKLTSSEWIIFVDPSPMSGWTHDCYTYHIPKTTTGSIAPSLIIERHHTLPPKGEYSGIEVKNRYDIDSNFDIIIQENSQTNTGISQRGNTYAIILSGGAYPNINFVRYWYDCSFIYSVLTKKYNIPKDHIYPIMADGDDPTPDTNVSKTIHAILRSQILDLDDDGINEIELAATKVNINNTLLHLAEIMKENDHLFIYVMDHGGADDYGSYICLWDYDDTFTTKLYDYELSQMLQTILDKKVNVNLVLGQCNSGGFINDLTKIGCVVATACTGDEASIRAKIGGYYFDEFVYHWTCAINEADHKGNSIFSDIDNDGYVTMEEAFMYALKNDRYNPENEEYEDNLNRCEHPQYISTPISIGEDLSFNRVPDKINLYIKDNTKDTGKQPNITNDIIWDSPDIWLTNDDPNGYHESIELNQQRSTVNISVNIHNRGIHDYDCGEYLHLYWCNNTLATTVNTWLGLEKFNNIKTGGEIATVEIPPLPAGGTTTITINWELPTEILNSEGEKYDANILARITNCQDFGNSPFTPIYSRFIQPKLDRTLAQKCVTIRNTTDGFLPVKTQIRNDNTTAQTFTIDICSRTPLPTGLFRPMVKITLSNNLLSKWIQGGKSCSGISQSAANPNSFSVVSFPAEFNNITLLPNEIEDFDVLITYVYDTSGIGTNPSYTFDLTQRNLLNTVIDGCTIKINPYRHTNVVPNINTTFLTDGTCLMDIDNDGEEYSSLWFDKNNDVIGIGGTVTVYPTKNNTDFSIVTINSDGAVGIRDISFRSQIGIKSIQPQGGIFDYIDVTLNRPSLSGSRFEISGIMEASARMIHPIEQGLINHRINITPLSSGWYILNLWDGNILVDQIKFFKQ